MVERIFHPDRRASREFLNFSHVHVLVAVSLFEPHGVSHLAPPRAWQELAELWRHTVLRCLPDAGAPAGWQLAKIQLHTRFTSPDFTPNVK